MGRMVRIEHVRVPHGSCANSNRSCMYGASSLSFKRVCRPEGGALLAARGRGRGPRPGLAEIQMQGSECLDEKSVLIIWL